MSALAACGNEEDTQEPQKTTEQMPETEDTTNVEEAEEQEDTDEIDEIEEDMAEPTVEGEYAMLMPESEGDLEEEPTVLANLQMITEEYASVVQEYEQDWLDIWSGIVTMDPETEELKGYFLLVNDMDEDVRNVTFTISLINEATEEPLFEKIDVSLSEEEYGIWEDQTVMPFSVNIPQETEEEVMNFMKKGEQGVPLLENMEYDTVE